MKFCKFCHGQKVVTSPSGIYQRCPLCDGSGRDRFDDLFYEYSVTFVGANVVGANANFQNSVSITDADFEWQYALAVATGPFQAQVLDGGTKVPFSNMQVHQNLLFGTAANPMALERTHIFKKMGSILVQGQDLSGANNSIYLGFLGVQIPGLTMSRAQVTAWLHGLGAAFIGGGAGAITAGGALTAVDPREFNFHHGLAHLLVVTGSVALVGGLTHAAAYLQRSPLPTTEVKP